jgi:hypothetical protein
MIRKTASEVAARHRTTRRSAVHGTASSSVEWRRRIYLRLRVAAAFFADRERSAGVREAAAFRADRDRDAAERREAARRACRDKDLCVAAARFSRFKAPRTARERVREVRRRDPALRWLRAARRRVFAEVLPFLGGGSFTPLRRALDRPIAMACRGERAPCLPLRTWRISSLTNSPACVAADLPSRASSRAFSRAFLSVSRSAMGTPSMRRALEWTLQRKTRARFGPFLRKERRSEE